MVIGVITEGISERKALEIIIEKVTTEDDVTLVKPIHASIEPKAKPGQIAKAAEDKVNILLKSKNCDLVVLVLDNEDSKDCIITRAKALKEAFEMKGFTNVEIVIKVRQFENWLIADADGIGAIKNFNVTQSFRKRVSPNKADNVDNPVELLKRLKKDKKAFDKNGDVLKIAEKCDPHSMAKNSRSFRRFLRLIRCTEYKDQSKSPVSKQ
jgi:hypothetical protein